MLEKNEGHIVTIASMAGQMGVPGLGDYCASKFGAIGFNDSLRIEFTKLKKNIKTTCICPYYINTGMFNGVSTPFYAPILEENYTIRRIVDAILQDETTVMIPWHMGLTTTLVKFLLPDRTRDWLFDFLKFTKGMDTFKNKR